MVTYEDQIKMLEEIKAYLIKAMDNNIAGTEDYEWMTKHPEGYEMGLGDGLRGMQLIVLVTINDKIKEAKEKLAECNTVTTMSAGVSLLDKDVQTVDLGEDDPHQVLWRKGATKDEV